MSLRFVVPWLAVSAACATPASVSSPSVAVPQAGSAAAAQQDPDAVMGSINGVEILRSQIPAGVEERIIDLTNELEQRRFHLLRAGFEDAVDQSLLAAASDSRSPHAAPPSPALRVMCCCAPSCSACSSSAHRRIAKRPTAQPHYSRVRCSVRDGDGEAHDADRGGGGYGLYGPGAESHDVAAVRLGDEEG